MKYVMLYHNNINCSSLYWRGLRPSLYRYSEEPQPTMQHQYKLEQLML